MRSDKKNTSMEFACQQILQKIMAGEFVPGTPLREDHIAAELGISSTPVREAFRRLEYDVEAAQERIRAAGLPERLAERLAVGR